MALLTSETAPAIGRLARGVPKPSRRKVILPLSYEDQATQWAVKRQLQLIAEQIKRTRERLNDDNFAYCEHCERSGMPDSHRAQLLRALSQLLEDERVLRRIAPPKPEPSPRPAKATYASGVPVAPQPIVRAPAQSGPSSASGSQST